MKFRFIKFNEKGALYIKLTCILLLSCVLFSGCWNYSELTDLAIILGAAIDKNDDGTFTLTMEVVSFNSTTGDSNSSGTSSNNSSSGNSQIVTSNGDTIYEAINNTTNIVGMTTYWNHARIIILSNKLNGDDFKRVLDCLVRNNETNINTKLFVAQTENAYDVFHAISPFHNFLSFDIYFTQTSNNYISESLNIELFQLIDEYGYAGSSVALPSINITKKEDKDLILISGLGIFDKEEFVGFIPEKDTMFYLFAIDKVNKGEISIKTNEDLENNANISLKILDSKTKITPQIINGKFKVTYDVNIEFSVTGYAGKQNFSTNEDILLLERTSSKYLEDNILKFLKKMQSAYETDIFYLSKFYRGKFKDEWHKVRENWQYIFKNIEFEVNVKSKIIHSGSIISIIKES